MIAKDIPNGKEIQAVILSKQYYPKVDDAASWVRQAGGDSSDSEDRGDAWVFHQFPPNRSVGKPEIMEATTNGVTASVCKKATEKDMGGVNDMDGGERHMLETDHSELPNVPAGAAFLTKMKALADEGADEIERHKPLMEHPAIKKKMDEEQQSLNSGRDYLAKCMKEWYPEVGGGMDGQEEAADGNLDEDVGDDDLMKYYKSFRKTFRKNLAVPGEEETNLDKVFSPGSGVAHMKMPLGARTIVKALDYLHKAHEAVNEDLPVQDHPDVKDLAAHLGEVLPAKKAEMHDMMGEHYPEVHKALGWDQAMEENDGDDDGALEEKDVDADFDEEAEPEGAETEEPAAEDEDVEVEDFSGDTPAEEEDETEAEEEAEAEADAEAEEEEEEEAGTEKKSLPSDDLDISSGKACILPGQEIQGRIMGASKAWYAGKAFRIKTTSGVILSVTTNHPVLTMEGFSSAGDLRKGQHLLHYIRKNESTIGDDNEQNTPVFAEELFESLLASFGLEERSRATGLNFHGDGKFIKGDVDIVRAAGQLRDDGITNGPQRFQQCSFRRGCEDQVSLSGSGGLRKGFDRHSASPVSVVSCLGESQSFFPGHLGQPYSHGLGTISQDATIFEPFVNNRSSDGQVDGDLVRGFSSQIVTDNDINGGGRDFSCHLVVAGDSLRFASGSEWDIGSTELFSDGRVGASVFVGEFCDKHPAKEILDEGGRDDSFALSDYLCFGFGSELDTEFSEKFTDGRCAGAVLASKLCNEHPLSVVLDEIVDIHEFSYDGWVYDFQSPLGFILAEGLVVSNCKIVRDGKANGKPLTEAQRGMFGAKCGEGKKSAKGKQTVKTFKVQVVNGKKWATVKQVKTQAEAMKHAGGLLQQGIRSQVLGPDNKPVQLKAAPPWFFKQAKAQKKKSDGKIASPIKRKLGANVVEPSAIDQTSEDVPDQLLGGDAAAVIDAIIEILQDMRQSLGASHPDAGETAAIDPSRAPMEANPYAAPNRPAAGKSKEKDEDEDEENVDPEILKNLAKSVRQLKQNETEMASRLDLLIGTSR